MSYSSSKDQKALLSDNISKPSLPLSPQAQGTQPLQFGSIANSLMASARVSPMAFSTPKIFGLQPKSTALPGAGLGTIPGALQEANNYQKLLLSALIQKRNALGLPVNMTAQESNALLQNKLKMAAENHLNSELLNSYVSQLLLSKKELEEKLQRVTAEKEILQSKVFEYEQKELAKIPFPRPAELLYVPKKKRTRRLATQIARTYKCPDSECQKSYGSETSLNLHIRKKHPNVKSVNNLSGEDSK